MISSVIVVMRACGVMYITVMGKVTPIMRKVTTSSQHNLTVTLIVLAQ